MKKANLNGTSEDFEIILNPIKGAGFYSTNIKPIQNNREMTYDASPHKNNNLSDCVSDRDIAEDFSRFSVNQENRSMFSHKAMNNVLYGSTPSKAGEPIGGDFEADYSLTKADK